MITFDKGGGSGGSPEEAGEFFFKKIKQNGSFSFRVRFFKIIFFYFSAGLPKSPKTMSLVPRSHKIITSALQLPEKK